MDSRDRIETRIQFRAGDQLFAFLAGRSLRMGTRSADLQARAEIETWRDVMAAELRRVPLTVGEANCLASILKGHRPSSGPASASIGVCYAEAEQAFHLAREIAERAPAGKWWGIDEDALLDRLRRLGPAADLALQDAIAHWHGRRFDATAGGFEAAGLRIINPVAGQGTE
jgi:hypothetical protein